MTESGGTMDMPLGMAMSIAEDPEAMTAFCRIDDSARAELIKRAKSVRSREEMDTLIDELKNR